ncbi:BAG domain protein [Ceratobasidium sp. AG-Ba]|nr:BAG domain protein [Ceratobasidium sp. AG-Ba]
MPTRPPATAWDCVSYEPQAMYDTSYYFPTYQYSHDPYAAYIRAPPPSAPRTVQASPVSPAGTTSAHNTIGWVLKDLEDLVKNFKFPSRLDFSEPSSNGQVPRLADTRRNQPLSEHRSSLEYLLDVLNGVPSYRDEGVKVAREKAIARVRKELEEIKLKKATAWKNQLRRDARPLSRVLWYNW